MSYEPNPYSTVPDRRNKRSGVTIALVVILVLCVGCAAIGGIATLVAGRGVVAVLPTIQAGIAATLTATAGPAPLVANNRQVPPAQPANTTPRPTNTPAPTATLRPTPTPTPVRPTSTPLPKPQVAVQQLGYYRDTFGELWFMGELLNSGALEAGDFHISVELIGTQGQVVARGALEATEIGVVALKPGQKTIWQVKLPQAPRQWQTEHIEATTGPVLITRNQSPYLELRADGAQFSPGEKPFNKVTASGQLANTGLAMVRDARAKVAIYDDTGKLLRIAEAAPKFQAVPAGGSVPFTVEFWDLDQPPAHFALYFTNLR